MKLDRMRCNTCGRQVAFRLIRVTFTIRGMTAPGIRKPVRHHQPGYAFNDDGEPVKRYCPAGEP
jgi:hypothetical protein